MSERNPKYRQILDVTVGIPLMRKHFCKSYLNLARVDFFKKHKKNPTMADAQELYDLYEAGWKNWYINKPVNEKQNREIGKPIWQFGCQFKVDVRASLSRFLEFKYSPFVHHPDRMSTQFNHFKQLPGYYEKSAANIMEEYSIQFIETHIMENNLLDEYKSFIETNAKHLNKYFKQRYSDYSHLAYNGVTDDF